MATLLTNCTVVEQPPANFFLWSGDVITSEILKSKLKPTIHNNRESLLSKGVLLLPNKARPHSPASTVEATKQLTSEILPQLTYSPGLAASDYHMFGPPKRGLA
jgi:hypothetical protein